MSGNGTVSGTENQRVITTQFVLDRILGRNGFTSILPANLDGAPTDRTGRAAQALVRELLDEAEGVFKERAAEALAAFAGVVRDATRAAGSAFLSVFDPAFILSGRLQPVILGIPWGAPNHDIQVGITKDGIGFGLDTSLTDIGKQVADHIVPFLGGGLLTLMSLGLEDRLGVTFQLPVPGIFNALLGDTALPPIDPNSLDWLIRLRGGIAFLDFDTVEVTGLVVPPGNAGFVDARVQKLWLNPNAAVLPDRIPIQEQSHYNSLIKYGGVLLTGRVLMPKLITDPVALIAEFDLTPPSDPLAMPEWLSRLAAHLQRGEQPALVQVFVPSFDSIMVTNFVDATTEEERISWTLQGTKLKSAVQKIADSAYFEGTWDGTLFSVPFGGRAKVTVQAGKLKVSATEPFFGLAASGLIDEIPVTGLSGPFDLPAASGPRRSSPRT